MNNRKLTDISADLRQFYQIILEVTARHPQEYDVNLKFPTWRGENSPTNTSKPNKPEDYMNDYKADMAKFSVHASLLQSPSNLTISAETHQKVLATISGRLVQHIKNYEAHFENNQNKNLCTRLINDLDNVHQIVQNTMPGSTPSKRPPSKS